MSHRNAILLQALAAALFSTAGLFIKIIDVNPLALAGTRSLIAAAVIGVYVALTQGRPRFAWSLPLVGGAVAMVGAQIFFVVATRQTTAANAVFIQYTAPIYVAIFGIWFLGERAKPRDWAAMAAIGVGLFLFFDGGLSAAGFWGNVNALLSGISFAWFVLFLRKQKDGSTVETVLLGNILAALIGLPFLIGETPTIEAWGGMIFMGIFQLGIPFVLMSICIRYLTAVDTVLVQTLEPILNPIWVFVVIGEAPTPLALLGSLVVLVAVTVRSLLATQEQRRQRRTTIAPAAVAPLPEKR